MGVRLDAVRLAIDVANALINGFMALSQERRNMREEIREEEDRKKEDRKKDSRIKELESQIARMKGL